MVMAFEALIDKEANEKLALGNTEQSNQMQYFHDELYCGVFYSIFRNEIQKNIMKIIFNIDAMSFYLQSMSQKANNNQSNANTQKYTLDALMKSKTIKDLSESLFSILNYKSKKWTVPFSESKNDSVNIDSILSTCIENFNFYLTHIMTQNHNPIKYSAYDVPQIFGEKDAFENCFDYLILVSYQFLYSRRARQVRIELKTSKNAMIVDFINDGSQMLQDRELTIECNAIAHLSTFHPRDQRHINWLCYAISNLHALQPKLRIQSESGKNRITLYIPLHTC
jgi:hypothetical protein